MGNCQAAEAATVLIQHPASNKVERIYRSIKANEVMSSNPGYYIAMIVTSTTAPTEKGIGRKTGENVKQLKLLKPDDTLDIGHVYRLISFEDVLKEFTLKKSVKLGKLLKESGVVSSSSCNGMDRKKKKKKRSQKWPSPYNEDDDGKGDDVTERLENSIIGSTPISADTVSSRRHNQWKPALQSIAEVS